MESTKQSILFHKKPITDIRFHADGDVFFASSKDCTASMINLKGEILGSFEKHEGIIAALAVNQNTLATIGFDLSIILWNILDGSVISTSALPAAARGLDFSDNTIYFCSDNSMGKEAMVGLFDPRSKEVEKLFVSDVPLTRIFKHNNSVIFSTAKGSISSLDLRTNTLTKSINAHLGRITSLRPSACRSFFVSGSTDSTVKIFDSNTLEIKKKFGCDEPINSACIFNTNDKLIAVGGIDARDVTTTRGKSTFDTNVFDVVTQQLIGSYTTHFGTINAVDVHADSSCYCSGGEDGSISLVKLGDDFYSAPFTKFD